jgi:hypothetical protein
MMTVPSFRSLRFRAYRTVLAIVALALIPVGLCTKAYRGQLDWWVNDYAGAILYEAFWIVLVAFIWPQASPAKVATGVFAATALLECLQLWQPPFLQAIRATWVGRTLLGTTFVWWDFLYYVLGCALTWLALRYLKSKLVKVKEETV